MSISVVQTCDGCGCTRTLDVSSARGMEISLRDSTDGSRWRQVEPKKHLCDVCIRRALNTSVEPD